MVVVCVLNIFVRGLPARSYSTCNFHKFREGSPSRGRNNSFKYHDVSHGAVFVTICGNNHVNAFHDALKRLVQVFLLQLELKKSSVHLVHKQHWLDPLGNSLTKNSLCLHTHTYSIKQLVN